MKRWLPYVCMILGLAGLIAGWQLYPSTCSPRELYRNVVEAFPPCDEGRYELIVSLGFLTAGLPLFVGGWMWALTRHAPRITTRIGPRLLAGFLLFDLVLVTGAGWFGWQKYDDHHQAQRLKAAESALAKLALPEGMVEQPSKYCPTNRDQRCLHTMLSVRQAEVRLIDLLHGQAENFFCARGHTPVTCYVTIRGTLGGYSAFASVSPTIYNEGEPHPPGAQQLKLGNRVAKIYVYGNQVVLGVLIPEE